MSEALRRLAANIDRTRTVVLFGNRLAENAKEDAEDATPGGRALRFYASIRLAMRRGEVGMDELGAAGASVQITAVKNKVAPPLRRRQLQLAYGRGFQIGD